ncbi:MAG TPA: secretin N-terminal domain-containing protein, partial [Phycisphaerae bacterium]|nr:secretin N-terminal domain-containing protein [Phycisphaerae bacterium]
SSLIVSGSPQNLAIVESLLKEIDREDIPNLPAGAAFFPIRHADVVNVADLLEKMFEGMKASMSSEQKDQLEAKIMPDTRSKALIVAGTKLALKRAEDLIKQLDQETVGAAYRIEVYKLKESPASRIEPVMTEMFEKRVTTDQAGKRTPIHIIGDDFSNSLVVTASEDDHKMAKHLIDLLDRKSTLAEQLHVIPLAKAQAEQVADMLQKLLEKQQTGTEKGGGFAVTPEPRTNSLLVWAAPDMLGQIKTIVDQLDNTNPKTEMALKVFQLKNAKAEDLAKLLDEFFEKAGAGKTDKDAKTMLIRFAAMDQATGQEVEQTLVHQDVTISPDKNTNSLMVLAPEKHIHMVGMMVKMLDSVEPQTADIQVFPLRNADASEMKKLLEDLIGVGKGGQDEERRQFVIAGAEGGAQVAAGGASLELAFGVDERTNSLIAAGSPSYLKVVEQLVFKLDYQEIEERRSNVIQLRNRPAEDIAKTLKAYYEEESSAYEKAAGEGEAKLRQFQRQVNVQDGGEGSNTLVVSYNPRMESQVVNMINELDRAPAMVMIQVLIAEVTLNDQFEMGLEFALQDLMFSENAYTGPNNTLQGDHYDVIGGTDVGAAGESALGGISLTITGEDFNFLVRALQTEGRLEILSRPSILVQDNQDAEITIGERVPTVQDVVVSGGGVVTPSVTYEKVGVILKVTPIVNPDGFVSMTIEPEISAIGTSSVTVSTGLTLPTFTERSAKTSVTVKNNETIIIGGLITSRETNAENKVPLVGDVPILGNLFRATNRKNSKTELLMVLTPHVIRTPEEARALSVQMRDQTGMIDNVRHSPLMQQLQVQPQEDQFGPEATLKPTGEQKPREGGEMLGPEVEPLGPPVSSATTQPAGEPRMVTVHGK